MQKKTLKKNIEETPLSPVSALLPVKPANRPKGMRPSPVHCLQVK
jgi:hypothetical protein